MSERTACEHKSLTNFCGPKSKTLCVDCGALLTRDGWKVGDEEDERLVQFCRRFRIDPLDTPGVFLIGDVGESEREEVGNDRLLLRLLR